MGLFDWLFKEPHKHNWVKKSFTRYYGSVADYTHGSFKTNYWECECGKKIKRDFFCLAPLGEKGHYVEFTG